MKSDVYGKAAETMLGATTDGNTCDFRVWAPYAQRVTLRLMAQGSTQDLPMRRDGEYFVLQAEAVAGDRYFYIVDEHKPVPDPVSRLLPEGVHGPTEIVDPSVFRWDDRDWGGLPFKKYIVYELHIGTFTEGGTLGAAIEKLPYLRQLGITVIELMPVAAFPGTRNWGYDGVSLYAVQASYGGPEALRRFVNTAHRAGLAVVLDVVYNHFGPEGNYLRLFGPYFTAMHKTPWGDAINYDQECCQGVRNFVTANAQYWIREYHIDGLRLDAVQTILDDSPTHILAEIRDGVVELARELGKQVGMIAETDRNDATIVRPRPEGGYGYNALWSDDFHHALHAFFTGERGGFYQDFGAPQQIVQALNEGFVFQGEPFQFWGGEPRGTSAQGISLPAHLICVQNHDMVGNRAQGERLTVLVSLGVRLLSAALLLLAPETPLLFMGQEYDESNPFLFFTNYNDPEVTKAVREGRRNEFKDFGFPSELVPDPEDPATFERSKLNWQLASPDNRMLEWYRRLIEMRKKYVVSGERTCKAEFVDGVIHLQVPAQQPVIKMLARIEGAAVLSGPGAEWKEVLAAEEDGFPVRILLRSSA